MPAIIPILPLTAPASTLDGALSTSFSIAATVLTVTPINLIPGKTYTVLIFAGSSSLTWTQNARNPAPRSSTQTITCTFLCLDDGVMYSSSAATD